MAIPGPSDAALADIENTGSSIRVKLTTIQYGVPAHRDIAGLRQLLQDYVDMVMKFAKDVGSDPPRASAWRALRDAAQSRHRRAEETLCRAQRACVGER